MDPRLPNGKRPVFATMSLPGHHLGEMPQSQPPPPPLTQPPHHQQQQLAAEAPPPELGPNSYLQEASYRTKSDQHKNGSRRMKGLDVIQAAFTNPVPRCRQLDSQIALEEITFWTNVCNMWLLENKQEPQPHYGEQGGGGESMMDMGNLVPDASTGQDYYYYYYNNNNNNNNKNGPSHDLHGEATTTDQPSRKYPHPPPPPPPTSTTTTIHSNGIEAIRAALNHNSHEDPTMPISIAATVGPLQTQTPLSAHHHHHQHPNSPTSWTMQSQSSPQPPPTATTTTFRHTADYKNNPYATIPRRGGRRHWRGQVPRPAGLQTRAEREFNGVDVYGRYKPDA